MTIDTDLNTLIDNYDHHDPALADETVLAEVHSTLRSKCPVQHTDAHGGFWVVSRYADVSNVARDFEQFSSAYGITIPGALPDPSVPANLVPPFQDPPAQTAMRKMLLPWFTPQAAKSREASIERLANDVIDGFIDNDECDLGVEFAEPFPALFMLRLLGVPDEMWQSLAEVIRHTVHEGPGAGGETHLDPTTFATSLAPVLELAEQRRTDPKDDLLTHLVQAEVDGKALDPVQLLATILVIIGGGVDTTANAIGSSLVYLGRHRQDRQRLIDDPGLMATAVEEFLRMWSPFNALARYVKTDCAINDEQLKPGDRVLMLWGAANRDEQEFDEPQTVRIERSPNRHLAFGLGAHRCIGSNYARSQLRIALNTLLARLPNYELIEDGVELHNDVGLAYGYRHVPARLNR